MNKGPMLLNAERGRAIENQRRLSEEMRDCADAIDRGMVCISCGKSPRIEFTGSGYYLSCNCRGTTEKATLRKRPRREAERQWRMVGSSLSRIDRGSGDMTVHTRQLIAEVKHLLAPTATDAEIFVFVKLCQGSKLNPFSGDVSLVPFGGRHRIIIGVNVYVRRAAAHPAFGGFQNGIVVLNKEGAMIEREGTIRFDGETLVGGWAVAHTKGNPIPQKHTVSLSTYNRASKGQEKTPWSSDPEGMIAKVALSQLARRFAGNEEPYPSSLDGIPVVSEGEEAALSQESLPAAPAVDHPAERRIPQSRGELFERADRDLGIPGKSVMEVLGVKTSTEIIDIPAAWKRLRESVEPAA